MRHLPVLVVEDDADLREAVCDTLRHAGFETACVGDGHAALAELERGRFGLLLTDVQMTPLDGLALLGRVRELHASLPVVLMTAYGSVDKAVSAMREGAAYYLTKPFEAQTLLDTVRCFLRSDGDDDAMVAEDPASRRTLSTATRVAQSEATVLLAGESGTGKEVLARHIHASSRRAAGPFVAINCAAIPENMLEAMLFGHEKGAFTGATTARPGKFEQAQGGTLLLDEISEMPLGLQAKLLRVLQEREVERLGGRDAIKLDVRIVATTNRDLRAHVEAGEFREDLYYRLSVFPLRLPPLRARPGDILPLARRALRRFHDGAGAVPTLSSEAERSLLAHGWPGNVRELENLVQRALIIAGGDAIGPADLLFEGAEPVEATPAPAQNAAVPASMDDGEAAGALQADLRDREQRLIVETLEAVNGSRKEAAERLGISPRTLRYKLARLRTAGVALPRLARA